MPTVSHVRSSSQSTVLTQCTHALGGGADRATPPHASGLCSALQYSLCNEPLIELSNPGASGSVFYVTSDDEFIIKTVMHKEAEFLQKLLPGYYMVRGAGWGGGRSGRELGF